MTAKRVKKEQICIIARNKKFFKKIANIFKKAQYEYVNVSDTQTCCESKNGYKCDLKIVAAVTSYEKSPEGSLPIVVIGGSDDVNNIVKSIKAGTLDFVERSVGAGKSQEPFKNGKGKFDEYKSLTKTERVVLHQIIKGKSNRQIADDLHRSIRTIEDHRNHIMRKLKADSLVDLIKKCLDQ